MNKEKWQEICFLLSENVKKGISEDSFEQNVIQALRVLNWKGFSGDFDIRPSFQIGASNRITPDFVIKNNKGKNLFVIEIKQPDLQLKSTFQKQLFSYMRQLKLEYGLLIGNGIQIFYDGTLKDQDEPILIESIKFNKDDIKGLEFVKLFDKINFGIDSLDQFTLNSIKKITRKKSRKVLKDKIFSNEYKEIIFSLIKQDLISNFDGELVDSILKETCLDLKETTEKISRPIGFVNKVFSKNNKKPGVINSIQKLIGQNPKTKEEVLNELTLLFPDRRPESMENTIRAQIIGKNRPCRMERERGIKITIGYKNNGDIIYFIKDSSQF